MTSTLSNISVEQLKRALGIREQMDALQAELIKIMGGEMPVPFLKAPKNGRRTMSASARARIGAAQKARWAKLRGEKPAKKGRKKMGAAWRAKIAAAAKARWAKAKAAGKNRL